MTPLPSSFLSRELRAFYRVLVEAAGRGSADGAGAGVAPLREELAAWLEERAATARQRGWTGSGDAYEEARYAMAALADETVAGLALAPRLRPADQASEAVFEGLERVLHDEVPDRLELAKIYLLTLGIGFRGRYRGPEEDPHLEALRRHLLELIRREEPASVPDLERIVPAAYHRWQRSEPPGRLPDLRRWTAAVAIAALVLAGVSYWLWAPLVAGLAPVLDSLAGLLR